MTTPKTPSAAKAATDAAAKAAIDSVAELGGHGGLIAVDRDGNIAMPFVSSGLKRAALLPDGTILSAAF